MFCGDFLCLHILHCNITWVCKCFLFSHNSMFAQMAGMDSLDDFGVDLYAVPDPVPMSSRIDREDENSRISAMVNNTASDWQRYLHIFFS